jgi:uncharacterized protein HemX
MNFVCPKCHRGDSIENSAIPESGLDYACPACDEHFPITKPVDSSSQQGTVTSPPPIPQEVPPPVPPPIPPQVPPSVPQPEPPANVTSGSNSQNNLMVVVALVCVLFLSLAGLGYYYFIKKKTSNPDAAKVIKPSVTNTESGKLNNFSSPKKPEQIEQKQVEVPRQMEQPQSEVIKERKIQAPLPKVRKPSKVTSPYDQDESEEKRQYKKELKYEKCRNKWCFDEVQGMSPVEAFKRCNDCEYLLR